MHQVLGAYEDVTRTFSLLSVQVRMRCFVRCQGGCAAQVGRRRRTITTLGSRGALSRHGAVAPFEKQMVGPPCRRGPMVQARMRRCFTGAAEPRKSDGGGALSGTPRSSLALRQGERSQRGRWRSRIANIPNRRHELTDFHDIQATKASSLGLPGVTSDKFGGVTLSCSCNMQ